MNPSDFRQSLPNLFLADLGPGLTLTPQTVREACSALRRNRESWLAGQRTRQLIDLLSYTAAQWLQPGNSFRQLLEAEGPRELGLGKETLMRGMDAFFQKLTADHLEALVVQDIGDVRRLDEFTAGMAEMKTGRLTLARGPELLVHVTAGNLPLPALMSLVLGVISKSAQFFKVANGSSWLPRVFAQSLAFNERKLGACLEFAEWPGGSTALEEIIFAEADCLTVTGSDETIREIRARVPARVRFLGYGHRVSFGFIGKELLSTYSIGRVVQGIAADVTAWNQLGCLSPHVIYVQDDGVVSPEGFAEQLADELARREMLEPRGELSVREAAVIQARRTVYQMRSAAEAPGDPARFESAFQDLPAGVRIWQSPDSTSWTVVYSADPRFEHSCLNRFVYVKPVHRFEDVLHFAEPIRQQVSTVALAVAEQHQTEVALKLARWGVSRICPVGRMQEPPPAWRHDGRLALGDLVTFTDLEN